MSGFSFKQLEEDEDVEDLTSYTGKYEKILDHSQKSQSKKEERSMSTSSVSSTSSGQEDLKSEKNNSASQSDMDSKPQNKANPPDSMGSPLRAAARQKIETSKELFSGLKGKIADKISKTIDEFSGDQSPRASPEKEIAKAIPDNDSDTSDLVFKETVPVLRGAPPEPKYCNTETETRSADQESNSEHSKSQNEIENVEVLKEKMPVSAKNSISEDETDGASCGPLVESYGSNLQSIQVENHPLAKSDDEEGFEDVQEFKGKSSSLDDTVYHDPQNNSPPNADTLVFHEHFDNVTDTYDSSGFTTSTKMKSKSVIKRLGKKERKTSAVATMSALHDAPEEELVDFAAEEETKNALAGSEKVDKEMKKGLSLNIPDTGSSSTNPTPSVSVGMLSLDPRSLPYQKLFAVAVGLFAYMIVPLPSYLSGLVMGLLLASAGWGLYIWLNEPPKPSEPFILPPLKEDPPVPQMKITTETEEFTYKVIMSTRLVMNIFFSFHL